MAITNRERVCKALELLNEGLRPFVERELKGVHGNKWEDVAKEGQPPERGKGRKAEKFHIPDERTARLVILGPDFPHTAKNAGSAARKEAVTILESRGNSPRRDHNISMHENYMRLALDEAKRAFAEDEVPIGAIIVLENRVIAVAHNQREQLRDPTAHAEMIAITQAAAAREGWRLDGCTLYVTLEPCPMCAGAIVQSRISTVVYGAADPKAGAVRTLFSLLDDSRLNHCCEIVPGVLAEPCGQILSQFFQQQRRLGKK